jgi:hypothetical protein
MSAPVETKERSRHDCHEPRGDVGRHGDRWVSLTCRHVWVRGALGWRATGEVEPLPPHPAPTVMLRDATDDERGGPRSGIRAIESLARRHGWTVRVTYAAGYYRGQKGLRPVGSVAVRMRRGQRRAFGIWHDGAFKMACRWEIGAWPVTCNATGLRAWITETDSGRPAANALAAPDGSTSGEVVRITGSDLPAIPTMNGEST